jgi:hypothetical protein
MRAMLVEVGSEIEQLVFQICRRPEQHVIQNSYLGITSRLPVTRAGTAADTIPVWICCRS